MAERDSEYGSMKPDEAKRTREPEIANQRLKEIDSGVRQSQFEDCSGKKLLSPAQRREAIKHVQKSWMVSRRRVCQTLNQPRSIGSSV